MDLRYGQEYETFRAQTRQFIESHRHLAPTSLALDSLATEREKVIDWQKLLIEHGYVARAVPKKYGGHGAEV